MAPSQTDKLIFESTCLAILCLRSLLSCATQILILQQGLSAREEIQPGDCFDIVGHSPGKPFLLSNQGGSGLRAIGSSVKTPHLITAVKLFEELKMCSASTFLFVGRVDSVQRLIVAI